jgi:hypothetical protein
MISWRFRRSKTIGGIRTTLSKSQGRRARVTGSTKIGPISISSSGRTNLNLFGFTIPLRRRNQS